MSQAQSVDLNFANALVDPWSSDVCIYLADKQPTHIDVISNVVMTRHEREDGMLAPPMASIKLSKKAAQGLLDAFFAAGLRPSSELDSIGQLKALQSHLADMRQISFMTLGLEKP